MRSGRCARPREPQRPAYLATCARHRSLQPRLARRGPRGSVRRCAVARTQRRPLQRSTTGCNATYHAATRYSMYDCDAYYIGCNAVRMRCIARGQVCLLPRSAACAALHRVARVAMMQGVCTTRVECGEPRQIVPASPRPTRARSSACVKASRCSTQSQRYSEVLTSTRYSVLISTQR